MKPNWGMKFSSKKKNKTPTWKALHGGSSFSCKKVSMWKQCNIDEDVSYLLWLTCMSPFPLWGLDACVCCKVRRVCHGSAPLGFIPLHISCFAHDNTVSFFKGTSCMYKPSEQIYYCTIATESDSTKLKESTLEWNLSFFYRVLQNLNFGPQLKQFKIKERPCQNLNWGFKSLNISDISIFWVI